MVVVSEVMYDSHLYYASYMRPMAYNRQKIITDIEIIMLMTTMVILMTIMLISHGYKPF